MSKQMREKLNAKKEGEGGGEEKKGAATIRRKKLQNVAQEKEHKGI